jgi:uncharacterized RDD family membrane protein YckC
MSDQYGEPSGNDQQSWGEGGWPQSTPPRGTYGQQGAQPEPDGYRQQRGGRHSGGYVQPTPPPGYGQQSGYGQGAPYAGPGPSSPPGTGYGQPYGQPYDAGNQPYGQPATGGYQPVPPSPASQYPAGGYGHNRPPYASWLVRVGSYLVDGLPSWVLLAIGGALVGRGGGGAAIGIIFYLAALAWVGYNRWYRAGTTGQSLGKSVTNVRLVDEQSGTPIGTGMAFLRDLAHIVDAVICYVGFLFPLWDSKRQTLADKIVSTVVVGNDAVPPQATPPQPPPSNYGW